jgi:hypothetical protein
MLYFVSETIELVVNACWQRTKPLTVVEEQLGAFSYLL